MANEGAYEQVRVGAEVWIKQLLLLIGQTGVFVMGIAIALIGLAIVAADRKKGVPLRALYFGGILGESFAFAIIVAFGVSTAVGTIFYGIIESGMPAAIIASPQSSNGLFTDLALSIGAGVYEELVFRVILVGGAFWVLHRLGMRRALAFTASALVGAFIFSAVHYTGSLGDDFTLPSFVFRFLFGLALNVIFIVRGFGIAAWTHAIYDILVVTGSFDG